MFFLVMAGYMPLGSSLLCILDEIFSLLDRMRFESPLAVINCVSILGRNLCLYDSSSVSIFFSNYPFSPSFFLKLVLN